jgi:hypothetical protein
MALSETQQILNDVETLRHQRQMEIEKERSDAQCRADLLRNRMELLRTAKEVLIENKKNKPVNDREVTEEDIVTFATSLEKYISK